MKTLLAALCAVLLGLIFAGSSYAAEQTTGEILVAMASSRTICGGNTGRPCPNNAPVTPVTVLPTVAAPRPIPVPTPTPSSTPTPTSKVAPTSPSLTLNGGSTPVTVLSGATVNVGVQNGSGNAGDWIGVYLTGTADSAYLNWFYLDGTKIQPSTGRTTATLMSTLPSTPGTYEFRIFPTGNGTFTRLAKSQAVTVAGFVPASPSIVPPVVTAPTPAPTPSPAVPTPIAAAAPLPTPISAPAPVPTSTPVHLAQSGANLPEGPRVYVDSTYVPPTGNVITVQAGGNLQAALNAAILGDVIELQAGATYPGKIMLPNKTSGTGWIIIRSSAWQSLPPPGTRVSPQHAALMAKITTSPLEPYDAAVATQEGAHHYRFIGIEVTGAADPAPSQQYGLFLIDGSHYDANNVYRLQPTDALTPHHIVIDRCYIHGTPIGEYIRGVLMDGLHIAIVDSYLSNFHSRDADTQAAIAWNTPGPLKLVNNYLEAAGENVMFGGAASVTAGYVPSDIEIRSNFFDKPLSWRPGDPSYAGIPWLVKNLIEFKDGQRALVEGNVFGHHWAGGQSGFFFVLTPRGEYNQNPWAFTGDITFRYNRILKTTAGLVLSGTDDQVAQKSNRVLFEHNVFENIGAYFLPGAFNGDFTMPSNAIQNLTIRHNSIFQSSTPFHFAGDSIGPMNGFTVVDNIFGNGGYGIMGETAGGVPELNTIAPGWVMRKNAIYGPYPNANGVLQSYYPADDYFPASQDAVGFVNLAGGDYHLAASSPYKNAGSDGKDVGADIDAVNAATACAMSGACGN